MGQSADSESSRRVLVLGGNGFIGRRIVAQLEHSAGTRVIAAGRTSRLDARSGCESLVLDATDEKALRRAMTNVTAIVNCIAGDPDTIVRSAQALFSAAAELKSSLRIVHLSSLAAYGSISGAVDESAAARGDLGPYSAAKLKTEELARRYDSAVILRPGIVYGPGSPWWTDRIARLLCARRLGNLGSAGEGLCNLVYVDDVATAVVRALCEPGIEGLTFNLSLSRIPTWNEYFAQYAGALDALPVRDISRARLLIERSIIAAPLKIVEIAASRGVLRSEPPPPIRPWLLDLCRHRIGMVVTQAETRLHMKWMPLSMGLKASADWYLAGGRT